MEKKPPNVCSVSTGTVLSASVTPPMFRDFKESAGKTKFEKGKNAFKARGLGYNGNAGGGPARPVSLTNISWI